MILDISSLLSPLENIINQKLIPVITGHGLPTTNERDLKALPVRCGGLGLTNPSLSSDINYENSTRVSAAFVD